MAALAVCAGDRLIDGGIGQKFLLGPGEEAFVIRFKGVVRAYRNRCPHRGLELDWQEGRFFDDKGMALVCSVHGARYDPADGGCLSGPCLGRSLEALVCREQGGMVIVEEAQP